MTHPQKPEAKIENLQTNKIQSCDGKVLACRIRAVSTGIHWVQTANTT